MKKIIAFFLVISVLIFKAFTASNKAMEVRLCQILDENRFLGNYEFFNQPYKLLNRVRRNQDGIALSVSDLFDKNTPGFLEFYFPYIPEDDSGSWVVNILQSKLIDSVFGIEKPAELEESVSSLEELESIDENLIDDISPETEDEISALTESETVAETVSDLQEEFSHDSENPEESGTGTSNEEIQDLARNESNKEIIQLQETVIKEASETPTAERHLLDNMSLLRFYSCEDEVFATQPFDENRVLISKNKNKLVRKYYDSQMKLSKKETWNVSSKELEMEERFTYSNGSKPSGAVIVKNKNRSHLIYDEKGQLVESSNYVLIENDFEEKKDDKSSENDVNSKKYYLDSKTFWKYSQDGKLLEKFFEVYEYKNKNYKKIFQKDTKRELYEYKVEEGKPDYFYYENGVLRLQTVYSARDSYITTMYFDNDFVVESHYEKNFHKKDYYFLKGILTRTVEYES